MWLRELLKGREDTAAVARQRLQVALAHQRAECKNPEFTPKLRRDLLNVLLKYMNGQPQEVRVTIDREDEGATFQFHVVFRAGTLRN